jgi:hypothetical protein
MISEVVIFQDDLGKQWRRCRPWDKPTAYGVTQHGRMVIVMRGSKLTEPAMEDFGSFEEWVDARERFEASK